MGELSNEDKFDVAQALTDLRALPKDACTARAYFLSPSSSEMDNMLTRQAELLRKCLQGHALISSSWRLSQERLLSGPDNEALTLGEGRLAAELQAANKVSG